MFLGELALRVNDLAVMTAFYRDVVGLEMFSDQSSQGIVFLKIADGSEGHPQILGLFDREVAVGQAATTLDHFAFVIELEGYEDQRARLEGLGVPTLLREFPHFHWRSIFFADPEGNTVEFVAYDPTVTDQDSSP